MQLITIYRLTALIIT